MFPTVKALFSLWLYYPCDKNGIKITKNLTINGNNHFIDGNNEATLFNITNSTVTINDLTLKMENPLIL